MQYSLYVDCMPTEDFAVLAPENVTRILECVPSSLSRLLLCSRPQCAPFHCALSHLHHAI